MNTWDDQHDHPPPAGNRRSAMIVWAVMVLPACLAYAYLVPDASWVQALGVAVITGAAMRLLT